MKDEFVFEYQRPDDYQDIKDNSMRRFQFGIKSKKFTPSQ